MPNRPIRQIISQKALVTTTERTTVAEAARTMKEFKVGAILVLKDGKLCGIFTERDALTRVLAEGRDPAKTPLARVMTPNPDTIAPDQPFGQALIQMYDHGYRHMPVVENGKPIGIVSMRDAVPPELHELEVDIEQREHISEILR